MQPNARLFLMPQQPYVPLGTLRRAATYPQSPDEVDDGVIRQTLEDVGLGQFARPPRRGGALGEHPVRRREAAPRASPACSSSARHRGDGRGDGGARSVEPGAADAAAARAAPRRRPSSASATAPSSRRSTPASSSSSIARKGRAWCATKRSDRRFVAPPASCRGSSRASRRPARAPHRVVVWYRYGWYYGSVSYGSVFYVTTSGPILSQPLPSDGHRRPLRADPRRRS